MATDHEISSEPLGRPSTVFSSEDDIGFREVDPVDVVAEAITVRVSEPSRSWGLHRVLGKKRLRKDNESTEGVSATILKNVSAEMPSGTLTAIIGSSGSGKTSL
jgi:ABC-type multidrug transport system fused ATPase/permease subunit